MKRNKGLYIQLYNIHGLLRGSNLELGKDADTGGQTKYVLELAKSLSLAEDVELVEIVTRYIKDKGISSDYSVQEEAVNEKLKIIRIRCGGSKYIRKELLWPHLEEFTDKSIKYIKSKGRLPDIIHSHYADAGFVGMQLSEFLNVPFIHTAHSLGKNKLNNLLAQGIEFKEIEKRYKLEKRIKVEEDIIRKSQKIITSTQQEIVQQYGLYKTSLAAKFVVIPPSIDIDKFYPFNERREWEEEPQKIRDGIRDRLWKFFTNMHKPMILSLCRPEKRKNISGLIEAYGESKELQARANLAIFAGIRKDITQMPDIEREVLTEMLLLMDKYNLYGKMAIPKRHDFEYEVPELYRTAAETRGVFVNSAYNEPFGLTLIEAASSGLPIVATNDGGPREIIANLQNGELVDVNNHKNISDAIMKIISEEEVWNSYSTNGISRIRNFYTWEAHTLKYLENIKKIINSKKDRSTTGLKLFNCKKLIIVDIDGTLLGNKESAERFRNMLTESANEMVFGVATGRTIDSARQILEENNFILPDLIISSVGAEIYYKKNDEYLKSTGWETHISKKWERERISDLLGGLGFLELQESETQRKHKISYIMNADISKLDEIKNIFSKNKLRANIILSHDFYLDILPKRANKGRAIRYISYRWNIPYENIIVAGDSGNDEDMFMGGMKSIIVANHAEELNKFKGKRNIYFSPISYAGGIIDGIRYYNFLRSH